MKSRKSDRLNDQR